MENNRIAAWTVEYRDEYFVNSNANLSQILTATRYEKGTYGSLQEGETTTYTYGNVLVSQYTEENGTEYYHYNNIGSTMYLTRNGEKTHEFAYSTYGELTKGEYGEVRFMYNGRLGVMTDSNGLYYMRTRYYNPEIRRFINQDVVTGSIKNSQSLNRYAYCQGNPVNYLDPFGLSPQSFGSWAGHTILNVLGFIPVFGNVADAFNAVWYAYEGNYAEAIACAVGAIPLIGNLVTGFKIGSNVVKGCNILANVGKASIGFYNGVQNVMNIDSMIRSGTGRWYDYVGQGVLFGLNMFVSASGVSGAWSGISNLVGELNYKKMQSIAKDVSVRDIDGGPELTELLEQDYKGGVGTLGNQLALPAPGQTSVLSRRILAEQKLAKAAQGSRTEGILIGKDGDVPVYQSQRQLIHSIESAGAEFVGNTRNGDGQIYHMNTPYGPVEIRIMQQKPFQTNPYLD